MNRIILSCMLCWLTLQPALSFGRTKQDIILTKKPKEVRNYIRPTLSWSLYGTGLRDMKGSVPILTNRLGQYRFAQTSLSFYAPVYTHTHFKGKDSTTINTFHLLVTANALTDRPYFSGLEKQHKLYKAGIGMRAIWAFGDQFVMMGDVNPFMVGDKYNRQQTSTLRLGATFVLNYMISPAFSVRAGVTKNFLFGNRRLLPMAGFRVGRLDGPVYFTFQFPRQASLTIQPGPKASFSIYSRAFGGLYNFSNEDSVYLGRDTVIQFGHTGVATGLRFDYRAGPKFNFFVSTGFATRNNIWFYSYTFNRRNNLGPLAHFYDARPEPALFVQLGFSLRFGNAKRSAGNYQMYDVFDINNSFDPGDNNTMPGNGDITPEMKKKKDMQKVQYKDVQDLVDEADLY